MNVRIHSRSVCLTIIVAASASARAQITTVSTTATPLQYQVVSANVTLRQTSPVAYFRGLLGMTPAERDRVLAGKPADYRKAVLDKVDEYNALPKDVREARLRQTQLRWVLISLMKLAPEARTNRLASVAPENRGLIEDRLQQWDKTPENLRRTVLDNENFLDFYLRWQAGSAAEKQDAINQLSAPRRAAWTNELARWESRPDAERQQLSTQFRKFLELNNDDQKDALTALSDHERQAMERTLQTFAQMTPSQRKICIQSFAKFAAMPSEERDQFLKNAERWERMTPDERKLWRQLVQRFPTLPPMPPGLENSAYPPLPPGMKLMIPASVATEQARVSP